MFIDSQPETDAMAPFILGSLGDDGPGEYPKCVALPMVTWARMGLDMRNRDFLRNSANLLEDFGQFLFKNSTA